VGLAATYPDYSPQTPIWQLIRESGSLYTSRLLITVQSRFDDLTAR